MEIPRRLGILCFGLIALLIWSTNIPATLMTSEWEADEEGVFFKKIMLVGIDQDETTVFNAKVTVDLLTDRGRENLYSGYSTNGFVLTILTLPLKYVTSVEKDGTNVPTYASDNILVTLSKGNYYGQYAFSIDPTFSHQAAGLTTLRVPMIEFSSQDWEGGHVGTPFNPSAILQPKVIMEYVYSDTPILSVAGWQNMQLEYGVPVGAKVRIEYKWRLFPYGTWYSSGWTEVTIENGFGPASPLAGNLQWKVYANLKYADDINPAGMGTTQSVYAVDTANDPYSHPQTNNSWGGTLPASNPDNSFLTGLNTYTQRSVTGGYNFIFTLTVGLSYPAAVTVSLGATLTPANPSWIKITAGSAPYGKTEVRTVSDGDTTFRNTFSNWIP